MKGNGLASACSKAKFKAHAGKANEADVPNAVAREFDGRAPRSVYSQDIIDKFCILISTLSARPAAFRFSAA